MQDEYNQWRAQRGLKAVVPRFAKKTHTIYVSNEALSGLKDIAEEMGRTRGNTGSISGMLEAIGLHLLVVSDPQEQTTEREVQQEYKDTDGLTSKQCFEMGERDYKENRPPNFHSSDLNGAQYRQEFFEESYIKGYVTAFKVDEESKRALPLQTSI